MTKAFPLPAAARLWRDCDTVLLDMDGTLLDLSFDNWFWREAVPRWLARATGGPAVEVRERLFAHFARKQGCLDWYCLDYWTRELGLDLRALKEASSHRIRYLPGAREFLREAQASGKRLVLVTNAHPHSLALKMEKTRLAGHFDGIVCAHALGSVKEQPEFWPRLREREPFDPAATLLVDDHLAILRAAGAFGIAHLVSVLRPDSTHPPKPPAEFPAIHDFSELLPVG